MRSHLRGGWCAGGEKANRLISTAPCEGRGSACPQHVWQALLKAVLSLCVAPLTLTLLLQLLLQFEQLVDRLKGCQFRYIE